ncbi:sensor histidine kinase [Pedosphaera parvula]|uniref:Integral membrane sensor signal transduction histidine kinase n=1 Tax=Pedosphaera parvula (strain Ellin514) TaxID=320771 RepID=B9XCF3_PEDPL|nr:sensor histidine kinase [Pedosphaera parvula]EEF62621.1 integral membrane sensor signal transduction histidine kinase [Pedosphaera parvula Ellin514]
MTRWIKKFEQYPKPLIMAVSLLLVAIIGLVDWMTGFEISFFVFYLIPVALAVWFVGDIFGIVVSVLSVAVWVAGDMTAGARYSRPFVPVWNAMIAVAFLIVVVGILTSLRRLHRELENRVRQRTVALTNEMQERTRLEKELLGISEREQRRIGHDLHDSLCQHLTGTALAGQVLGGRLAEKSLPEAATANHLVELVEEAIELTRTLARGLHPTELEGAGFLNGFQELAATISERFKISCKFENSRALEIHAPEGAIHLYRIAQEAITNAIKHGKAREIIIRLDMCDNVITLEIVDNGIGLPENARSSGQGMGLRIMAYRASIIGASFNIERLPTKGTRVICILPATSNLSSDTHGTKAQSSIG